MIFASEEEYKTRKQVNNAFPGATVIKKVCRGWMVFETSTDYQTWKAQK
jgi:hypothetical protein